MKAKLRSIRHLVLMALAFAGLSTHSAQAANLYWDSDATFNGNYGGTGTWDTSTLNWSNVSADQAWTTNTITGDAAVFQGTAGTVTLGSAINALGLKFATAGYTLALGGNTLTLGSGGIDASALASGTTTISGSGAVSLGAAQSWNVGTGATLAVSSIVSGSNSLTKAGAGTLTLSGANTYTGDTIVNAGTLSLTGSLSSANLTMGGATFSYDKTGTNTQSFTSTAIAGGVSYIKNTVSTDTLALGALSQSNGATVFFTKTGNISTSTTDGGNLIGGWAVIDNGNNTYDWAHSGASGVNNITAATYVAPSAADLGNVLCTSNVTLSNNQHTWQSVKVSGATLNFGQWNLYLNSGGMILQNGGTYTNNGNNPGLLLTNAGSFFVHVPDSGTIGALISNNGSTAANLYKDGPGTLTLSNAGNNFKGNIVINSGTIAVGTGINGTNASSIASNLGDIGSGVSRSITINNGGNLSFTGGNITGWDSCTDSGVTLVVNQGGVFQAGPNVTTNTGYWNKIGPMTLNGGSVLIGAGDTGTWGGALSLLGTVTVGGTTASTIGSLSGAIGGAKNFINIGHSNSGISSVTFNVADATGDSGADLTVSPRLADRSNAGGASSITKTGAGTMALTATNSTYTGVTTIGQGTLSAASLANGGSASSIGQSTNAAGNLVFDGGALEYTGATVSSDRAFTINTGKTATIQVDSSSANLTLAGATGAATNGALVKTGNGTLTLTGANTYSGATSVSAGTLLLSGSGSINSSSGITINGSGAKYVQTSTTSSTRTITLTQGTLDGTGTVGAVTVDSGTGGIVTNGNGSTTALTIGSLTFSGAGTMNVNTTGSAGIAVTGLLSTTGAGNITINANGTGGSWGAGTYNLITFGSQTGSTSANSFALGTLTGYGARFSGALGQISSAITLTLTGDTPKWTGLDNSGGSANWVVGSTGPNGNWKLITAGTATDYISGDIALFDDSAAGVTAVNISGADVNPASTAFNNSTKDYTLSSTGGFKIAGGALTKSGTGSLTISTANTYAGGTNVNGGTLALSGSGTLGATTGAVAMGGGKIDLGASSQTVGAVTITSAAASGNTIQNGSLSASSLTASDASGNAIITANLIGSASVTMSGSGTLTLAGANTYNGATSATAGTLSLTGSLTGSNVSTGSTGVLTESSTGAIGGSGVTFTQGSSATSTLAGTNTYNGGTFVKNGTVVLAGGGSLSSSNALTLGDGTLNTSGVFQLGDGSGAANTTVTSLTVSGTGTANAVAGGNAATSTLTINNSGTLSYGGLLGGSGTNQNNLALVKNGSGALTLSGSNTYAGGTTVSAGTLSVGNVGALGSGALTLNGGNVDANSSAANFGSAITNNIVVNGSVGFYCGNKDATYSGAITGSGTLNNGASQAGASLNITGDLSGFTGTLAYTSGGNFNNLNIGGSTAGSMDLSLAKVAISGTGPSGQFRTLNLGGSGSTTFKVGDLSGTSGYVRISAATLEVGNLGLNSTFGGVFTDNNGGVLTAGVSKVGTGTWTLTGANTYTGGTTVNNGTLAYGASNVLAGTGAINVNGGTLAIAAYNGTAGAVTLTSGSITGSTGVLTGSSYTVKSGSVSAILGGTGTLTKNTSGTVTLTGNNTYSGNTAVNAGTLAVSGSIGSSAVTVSNSGTTLASATTGTIGSSVTVNSGAVLAAGGVNAIGMATVGSGGTTLNSGSIFSWDLDTSATQTAGTGYDNVVTSSLSGSGAVFKVVLNGTQSFGDAFWTTSHTWSNILSTDGTSGGALGIASVFSSFAYANGSGSLGTPTTTGYFTTSGSSLTWTAVPESTSALAGLLIGAALLGRRRARE